LDYCVNKTVRSSYLLIKTIARADGGEGNILQIRFPIVIALSLVAAVFGQK